MRRMSLFGPLKATSKKAYEDYASKVIFVMGMSFSSKSAFNAHSREKDNIKEMPTALPNCIEGFPVLHVSLCALIENTSRHLALYFQGTMSFILSFGSDTPPLAALLGY